MKCKSKFCDLEIRHVGRCMRLTDATNGESGATNTSIKVKAEVDVVPKAPLGEPTASSAAQGATGGVARTANRRTKEAFNAYQRDYMRRRRARENEGAGGVSGMSEQEKGTVG